MVRSPTYRATLIPNIDDKLGSSAVVRQLLHLSDGRWKQVPLVLAVQRWNLLNMSKPLGNKARLGPGGWIVEWQIFPSGGWRIAALLVRGRTGHMPLPLPG